jgi:hypothetical protein
MFEQVTKFCGKFFWHTVTGGVGNIDGSCTSLDYRGHHLSQIFVLNALKKRSFPVCHFWAVQLNTKYYSKNMTRRQLQRVLNEATAGLENKPEYLWDPKALAEIKKLERKREIERRTIREPIISLKDNEIFVFGSNEAGIHGAGAARIALQWGAKMGVGIGIMGQTYALPTKDKNLNTLELGDIEDHVDLFIEHAIWNDDRTFLVTQIGCGLAGYTPRKIAPMFKKCVDLKNVHLPKVFWDILIPEEIFVPEEERFISEEIN